MASTPWAGSWQLCRALGATGVAGAPGEYFSPQSVVARSRAWGLLGSEARFPAGYLDAVRAVATGDNGVCTVSVAWSHLRWLVRMARAALVATGGPSCSDAEAVAAWFPDARYVHLRCDDAARQALRWYAAMHPEAGDDGGRPGPGGGPVPDFQEVRWLESMILRHDHSWESYFGVHGIVALPVEFEQLAERPVETVGDVLASLGLTPATPVAPEPFGDWGRIGSSEVWLDRYLEVREAMEATVGIRAGIP